MIKRIMKWFNNLFVTTKDSVEYLWVQEKINQVFSDSNLIEVEPFWVMEDEKTRINIAHIVTYEGQKYRVSGVGYLDLLKNPKEVICPTDLSYFKLFTLAYSLNCNNPKASTTLLKNLNGCVSAFSLPEGMGDLGILVTPID